MSRTAEAITVTSPQELNVASEPSASLEDGVREVSPAQTNTSPQKTVVNTITVAEVKQYITNLKRYIDHIVEAIRKGQYVEVNTTVYPTLADFLESEGEQGTVYLYPIDVSDTSKGYYQYIWEVTQWVSLGTTALDLSDYIKGKDLTAEEYAALDPKDPTMHYFIPEE